MIPLRKKIAQMLIVGFEGYELASDNPIVPSLQEEGLGGVIVFDYNYKLKRYEKNLKNPDQIRSLIQQLQAYAKEANPDIPLFVAIDYEGGAVDRLARVEGSSSTKSAYEMAQLSDEAFSHEAQRMASILKNLGFNVNFAPVVDLNLTEEHGIIGKKKRSFSADPERVINAAQRFVNAFNDAGIVCAYKHFPGHGSALDDTHLTFVDVTDTFQESELLPYQTLLTDSSSHAMVMTAHVINRRLDPEGLPATLSHAVLNDLLRDKLHFNGVVVSDDLQMKAISDQYPLEVVLELTINAGSDMLIFGNQLGEITAKEVIDTIERLVDSQRISPDRINNAYERIVQLKKAIFLKSECSIHSEAFEPDGNYPTGHSSRI